VFKLVSGTIIAQGVVAIAAPLLTRLYSPNDFGVLALFISVVGILQVISGWRYELAIMLPKADEEAVNVFGGTIAIVALSTCLAALALTIGKGFFLRLLQASELESVLWLISLVMFVGGLSSAFNYWNIRAKQFERLAIAQVVSAVAITIAQLVLGYTGHATSRSLIGANVLGTALASLILGVQIWFADRRLLSRSINRHKVIEQLKRYKKFPLYDAWAALLNTISWQLPAFLLTSFFSNTEVGYYALSFRFLKLPMSLVGTAIGQVFFQHATEAQNEGNLAEVVEDNFRHLVILGMLPFFLLTIVGQELFTLVFGANWHEAGVYAQILSGWVFFWFISSPMSTLFRVLEKQEFSLKLNVAIFASRFVALSIGGVLGNARLALLLFAISGVILYGYLSISIMVASGVSWNKIRRILASNALVCLGAGALMLLTRLLHFAGWAQLLVAILIGAGYFIYHGVTTFSIRNIDKISQLLGISKLGR
jgi:O-antigen/teichoic acid export membrane protein